MGYIDNVLIALDGMRWRAREDDIDDDVTERELLEWAAQDLPDWMAPRFPAHNPFRDVGRNDPCPCGSGKKAKKCCLRA